MLGVVEARRKKKVKAMDETLEGLRDASEGKDQDMAKYANSTEQEAYLIGWKEESGFQKALRIETINKAMALAQDEAIIFPTYDKSETICP